jgi:hypothetical protein
VPTFVSDDFARTSSSSWESADVGGAYTLVGTASDFSVASGWGAISTPVNVTRRADLLSTDNLETDWLFKLKVSAVPVGGNLAAYGYVRLVDGNNLLRATVRFKPSGNITLALDKFISSSLTSNIQTGGAEYDTGITPVAGNVYWLRVIATGAAPTTLKARFWADGGGEPSSWPVVGQVSDAVVQVASSVSVGTFGASAISNAPIVVSFGNARGTEAERVVLGTFNDFLTGWDNDDVFLDDPPTAGATHEKTGTATATTALAGADILEAVEAGLVTSATQATAADVSEYAETGTTAADTLATGASEKTAGTVTHEKAGTATASTTARATDLFEATETATATADTTATGTATVEQQPAIGVTPATLTFDWALN